VSLPITCKFCLRNKGSGTPFITGLDLRPLSDTLYLDIHASELLVLRDFVTEHCVDLINLLNRLFISLLW
jgi:hypothetical protein